MMNLNDCGIFAMIEGLFRRLIPRVENMRISARHAIRMRPKSPCSQARFFYTHF